MEFPPLFPPSTPPPSQLGFEESECFNYRTFKLKYRPLLTSHVGYDFLLFFFVTERDRERQGGTERDKKGQRGTGRDRERQSETLRDRERQG